MKSRTSRGSAGMHLECMKGGTVRDAALSAVNRPSRRAGPSRLRAGPAAGARAGRDGQLQPVVAPQVAHLRQVPLRTRVKLPHSSQASPS